MWYGLIVGELDDNIEFVFNDIICWLNNCSLINVRDSFFWYVDVEFVMEFIILLKL